MAKNQPLGWAYPIDEQCDLSLGIGHVIRSTPASHFLFLGKDGQLYIGDGTRLVLRIDLTSSPLLELQREQILFFFGGLRVKPIALYQQERRITQSLTHVDIVGTLEIGGDVYANTDAPIGCILDVAGHKASVYAVFHGNQRPSYVVNVSPYLQRQLTFPFAGAVILWEYLNK